MASSSRPRRAVRALTSDRLELRAPFGRGASVVTWLLASAALGACTSPADPEAQADDGQVPTVVGVVVPPVDGAGGAPGQGAGGSPPDISTPGISTGSGAEPICSPGKEDACYGGPEGTEGVGFCRAGARACLPDGSGFGECEGESLPRDEQCGTGYDEDCDGEIDEGCGPCEPGVVEACYSGSPDTDGVAACHAGARVCLPDGSGFGPCEGEVTPAPESCLSPGDDDCDGEVNESGDDCVCVPGVWQSCYSGDAITDGVGQCSRGVQQCHESGTGFGECLGDVVPTPEMCGAPIDEDCDGLVNEEGPNCLCRPGELGGACYSGPSETRGVGACREGQSQCLADGISSVCVGEVTPLFENCAAAGDEDCDGVEPALCAHPAWAIHFPHTAPLALASAPGGHVVVAGSTDDPLTLGQPQAAIDGQDVFVVRLASDGGVRFARRFGGEGDQLAYAVATTNTRTVVGGTWSGKVDLGAGLQMASTAHPDGFVLAYDDTGALAFARNFGGSGSEAVRAVAVRPDGRVLLGGSFDEDVHIGASHHVNATEGQGAFLTELDDKGEPLWSSPLHATRAVEIAGIAVNADGYAVVALTFSGTLSVGPDTYDAGGASDLFVATIAPDGSLLWGRAFGCPAQPGPACEDAWARARAVALGADGRVVLGGEFQGPLAFGAAGRDPAGPGGGFVASLDSRGRIEWSRGLGVGSDVRSVALGQEGLVRVAASFKVQIDVGHGVRYPATPGVEDIALAAFDAQGRPVWSRTAGGAGLDLPAGVAPGTFGSTFATGYFSSKIDLGGGTLPAAGPASFLVLLTQ